MEKFKNHTIVENLVLWETKLAACSGISGLVFVMMFLATVLKIICLYKKKWRTGQNLNDEAAVILKDLTFPMNCEGFLNITKTAALAGMTENSAINGNTEILERPEIEELRVMPTNSLFSANNA